MQGLVYFSRQDCSEPEGRSSKCWWLQQAGEPAAQQGCQGHRGSGTDLTEEQGDAKLPGQGHHSSGDGDQGQPRPWCQTLLQGSGTTEARPGSWVRALWSPRFPGISAGCFWQGPRNEASPIALCLALMDVLRLHRVWAGWAQRDKALALGRDC